MKRMGKLTQKERGRPPAEHSSQDPHHSVWLPLLRCGELLAKQALFPFELAVFDGQALNRLPLARGLRRLLLNRVVISLNVRRKLSLNGRSFAHSTNNW